MASLICSCCGNGFRGKQDSEHDRGFGTCNNCITTVIEPLNERFIKQGKDALKKASTPERWTHFCSWNKTKQDNFILMLFQKGVLKFGY
ncbi:hypothetical protein HUO09_16760 [Vibrio sp. Y2-5]|uniref:hypothetical protein n=1 Tax=Vibrio sp. Y2-5 TaxID=2743977 RepID=UPI00166112FD|nr:hypothetical protein [Vibrio sp. Y2-5]MBD0788006.1 hypothetical protein [Vibrio sp. Y2-5]